ncbi:MAG: T9SS type A sorting domain-containing protein [Bacteroidota bacterium]
MIRFFFLCLLVAFSKGFTWSQASITLQPEQRLQTMSGFGAFGGIKPYWETPPFYTDEFIDRMLHDLGATMMRTNIPWDLEPENDNSSSTTIDLHRFRFSPSSQLGKQLPYYRALKEAGLQRLLATAWTPPEWMKLMNPSERIPKECYNCNNCPVGDPRRKVCGGRLDPSLYHEFAEFLVAFVKILKQEAGVNLYGISIQNEPYFANPFESAVLLPDEYRQLLRVVGTRFVQEGLGTHIFGPEHMAEWSWGVQQDYVQYSLDDEQTRKFLDFYAVHGYVDGVAPDFGSAQGWSQLRTNITQQYRKPLWMTETSGYAPTASGALDLARSIYLALRFGEVSAWVYWSASGEPGSTFALTANGTPTVLYQVSKQFYRHVRPGAQQIGVTSSDGALLPVAFIHQGTGTMTLVVINQSDQAQSFALPAEQHHEFKAYRYLETPGDNEPLQTYPAGATISLPPASVTTLEASVPAGPFFNEVAPLRFMAKEGLDTLVTITGIQTGSFTHSQLVATSSDEARVSVKSIAWQPGDTEATLHLQISPDFSGEVTLQVELTGTAPAGAENLLQPFSRSVRVVGVQSVTSLPEAADPSGMQVYPNPVTAVSTIHIELHQPTAIEIFDMWGSQVYAIAHGTNRVSVDVSQWPSGLYFIRNHSSTRPCFKKFMVQH